MILNYRRVVALMVASFCVVGCSPKVPSSTSDADSAAAAAEPAAPAAAAPPAALAPDLGPTLLANRWQLESATDGSGQPIQALFPGPDNRLGIEFVEGQLGVTGGCNRLGAGYQLLEPSELQLGPARSTMMSCPPPLAAADAAIAKFLTGTLQAELQGEAGAPVLRLSAEDGTALTFSGQPTPETRFGGSGVRAFLEVSPEPCEPPAERPCLMVRERMFDEQGLPSGTPGEWRALPDGIEGYAPVAGEQQVVRVKRFESPGNEGGEPMVHYVFDMIVETRTVQ